MLTEIEKLKLESSVLKLVCKSERMFEHCANTIFEETMSEEDFKNGFTKEVIDKLDAGYCYLKKEVGSILLLSLEERNKVFTERIKLNKRKGKS